MSEISPTFVNWDETATSPPGGSTVAPGKRRPPATDLHIEFEKGGVRVKDKGKEAARFDYGDTRRNSVNIYFPRAAPIESARYTDPAKVNAHGAVDPPQAAPAGSSAMPTFTHADPAFPKITKWWWTHKDTRIPVIEFKGNPEEEPPARPKRPPAKR
jgi:hypothetical protein